MENRLGKLYSKWRQQAVDIKAGELKEVYFDNTNPNMFFISNFSDATIYGGLNRVPTFKSHEFRFRPHKQKPFGVPLGKRVLYLLNLSDMDVTVDVYSTEMEFDLNVLQDFSVDNVTITADDPVAFKLADVEGGVKIDMNMDGESKGLFSSMLKSLEDIYGDKKQLEELQGIKAVLNLIHGQGDGDNADTEILTEIKNLLSGENDANVLQEIKAALTTDDIMKLPDDLFTFETSGTTANKSCQRAYYVEIMFLHNDGQSDLELSMWQGDTTSKITIKPGETVKDIKYMTNTADNGFQVGAVDSAQRSYRLIARAKR